MSDIRIEKAAVNKLLSGIWWMILIRGIAMLIIGFTALFRPGIAAIVMVQFLGFFWFIDGIMTVAKSIQGRKVTPSWGWGIFAGILSILAAVVILAYPVLTAATFAGFIVFLIAFIAIFSGVTSIITGIRMRKEIDNEWSMIFGGLFTVIFGVLFMGLQPGFAAVWMIVTLGIFAVLGGLILITVAFKTRKAAKAAE